MYFTVHTDDDDDTDSLIFYNIRYKPIGASPQTQFINIFIMKLYYRLNY